MTAVAKWLDYSGRKPGPRESRDRLAPAAGILAVLALSGVLASRLWFTNWVYTLGLIGIGIVCAATAACWLLALSFAFAALREGGVSRTIAFWTLATEAVTLVATIAFVTGEI